MVQRGCCWIVLGFITIITMFIVGLVSCPWCTEWCNESIKAGYCDRNPDDKKCYCIDVTMNRSKEIDLYAYSKSACELRNGTLAAPYDYEIVLWLSKMMYMKGVDNAMVALLRDPEDGWYWNKGETRDFTQVLWRQDIPRNRNHLHAMLTVQTVIEREYDYVAYHNYDHYIDVDPNPCFCGANERINLPELDSHAIFTSPRYPNNYCSDNHCKWTFTTKVELTLQIEWLVFMTEQNMDFVHIYDGNTNDSPLMQSCSATDCDSHKSSGPTMQVHFSADHVITELGFKFKVTAIKPDACYCSDSLYMSITNSGETFIFTSPGHPNPYCSNLTCGWTISAPEGHAVDIIWDRFEMENDRDYLLAYEQSDGMDMLKQNCTGTTCVDLRSSGQEIRLVFVSDGHMSEAVGFRAIAKVIKNYCTMHAHKVPLGTITSSEPPREDGYIAAGTKVTVICGENYKIRNTVEDLGDSAICDAPQWSKLLICVPVCKLEFSVHYSMDSINFCSFGQNLRTTLVEQGHTVQVNTYDYINGNNLKDTKIYTCGEFGWSDQPPTCHPMGIVSMGIDSVSERDVELYTPTDKTNTSRKLQTKLLFGRKHYEIATLDGGGPILVMGGRLDGYEELLDINTNMSTTAPEMKELWKYFGAVNLNGVIYACGGVDEMLIPTNVCQRFQHDMWTTSPPMKEKRAQLNIVALGQWMYAIGGWTGSRYWEQGKESTDVTLDTVERYSVGTAHWEYVQPMNRVREQFGAATLDSSIFVCGGIDFPEHLLTETCEQYFPLQDRWQYIASMTTSRHRHSLVAFDGILFALGGYPTVWMQATNTIEKYYHNEWSIVAKMTSTYSSLEMETLDINSIVTSFIGNIPGASERYQLQSLPYSVDLSVLAKLTDTEPELTKYAPIAIDSSMSSHVDDVCACLSNEDIVLTGLEGSQTFQSPGYPDHYCDNHKCLWTISGTENLAIQLEWVSFSTENQMDMVFIYEGNDDNVHLVDVCSGSHCPNHLSEKKRMQVYFSSDHVATDIGFKARVTAVDPDPCHCYESKEIILASHIESYVLLSPNHPNSYCTNVKYNCTWIITGLQGYGPEVVWDFFNLGDSDVLSIFNGNQLLEECTGGLCSDLVSPGEQMIIHFTTTDCQKLTTHLGAIEYDREVRADGHLPVGTRAVFTCKANYALTNVVDQRTSDDLTCIAPHWDNVDQLVCESVCQLSLTTPTSWDNIHLCTYDDLVQRMLVPNGHKITLERHDFTNDVMLSRSNFECRKMEWTTAATPTCHKLGIFMMSESTIQIYWPMENISTMSDLRLAEDHVRTGPIITLLSGGRVLIGGGMFLDRQTSLQTHIIHLATGQVSEGPIMREFRMWAAVATFGGEPYVCGGFKYWSYTPGVELLEVLSSCEVLRHGFWQGIANMNNMRDLPVMAATKDALYVIGGFDHKSDLSSVEKYSRETNRWTEVAPMPETRSKCAAAEYNNVIYVCGGAANYEETKSCIKYDTRRDIWNHMDDLPSRRYMFSMVVFGSRIYALGGENPNFDSIDSLDIETEQWTHHGQLMFSQEGYIALVVPQY